MNARAITIAFAAGFISGGFVFNRKHKKIERIRASKRNTDPGSLLSVLDTWYNDTSDGRTANQVAEDWFRSYTRSNMREVIDRAMEG